MKKIVIALAVAAAALVFAGTSMAYDLAGIQIHGFISQGFSYSADNNFPTSDSTDGTFQHFDAGINFGKKLTDGLNIGLQLYARDYGDIDNNTVNIDWAYADYRWKNWLKIRAGKIKNPFGLYNEGRDIDMLRTFAFLPGAVYSEPSREIVLSRLGVGIYGTLGGGAAGSFDYNIVIGEPQVDEDNGGFVKQMESFLHTELIGIEFDISKSAQLIWNTPLDGFRVAGTFAAVTNDVVANFFGNAVRINLDTEIWIASAEYTWNNLVLAAEYASMLIGSSPDQQRYYGSATYRLSDLLEIGIYYSEEYSNEDDKDGDYLVAMGQPDFFAWQKDLCAAVRFDLNEYWIFKVEGHYMNGAAMVLTSDTPFNEMEEDWYYTVVKTTFSF